MNFKEMQNRELIVNGINKYNLYMITYHSPSEHVINNKRYAKQLSILRGLKDLIFNFIKEIL